LLKGTYEPKLVRRVEIPKPDGGVRKLGIPTVLDRLIQQSVMQVLDRSWNRTFSDSSDGFRPGRSAHQAVAQAQQYIAAGYSWVVDLDLEKFFDRVNHDKLMGSIAKRIEEKRLLKLIRAFLNAGVMENGLVSPSMEGTPQGSLEAVGSIARRLPGDLVISKTEAPPSRGSSARPAAPGGVTQNLGFASRPFVLCGLPIKRSPRGALMHERRNGHFLLQVTGDPQYGVPWGQDRLVPIFLATLAMRQQRQTITFRSAAEILVHNIAG
jgi:reverse transcriptase-like protein